jgi:solute carrier family 25 folate transporter 32
MVASIATYPHEVVRTQLQIQKRHLAHTDSVATAAGPPKHPGVVGVIREVVHVEGWRGLYKGLSVNLLRTVPNSAVTMLTYVLSPHATITACSSLDLRYELLMRYLHDHH